MTWVDDASVSKLLGTPVGLTLAAHDVETFLEDRVTKKLQHWCTAKINSTGHGVIVNNVLLSSVMFFALIWGGTERGVKKVTSAIQNYLWSGTIHWTSTKVAWA